MRFLTVKLTQIMKKMIVTVMEGMSMKEVCYLTSLNYLNMSMMENATNMSQKLVT